jgi:isocitrate dehydrogenase
MTKLKSPKLVYVAGEEMSRYTMEIILKSWIEPYIDTQNWQFFDLSCISRDKTQDQVLKDVIKAGAEAKVIFKEPTITPTNEQVKEFGLSKAWGSPNGAMRRGWNGFTISRDTIHIDGIKLGYDKKVMFDRHAVGGEYGAGYKMLGQGKLKTVFEPQDGSAPIIVDERELVDNLNAAVTYHDPLDNVVDMAHHFFKRSLAVGNTPYIVTKQTVFKWQEDFWRIFREVFDEHYLKAFNEKGLLNSTDHKLQYFLSDVATMKLIAWTKGGFSMACHNYNGDVLTDELAQVHRSPGFISSCLIGKASDGKIIKEFEASHGTVTDMDKKRLRGEETSMNPVGMVFALVEALEYADELYDAGGEVAAFARKLYASMCKVMSGGKGTRDLAGPSGATTEQFVAEVASELKK